MNLCVLGAHIHANVGVLEQIWLNVRESTCETVCVDAHIHVDVGVREWIWLKVCESSCTYMCVGCKYTWKCGCS